jgi:hypothetical protein
MQSLNSHVRLERRRANRGGLLRVNLSSGSQFFRPGMEYYRARKLASLNKVGFFLNIAKHKGHEPILCFLISPSLASGTLLRRGSLA